MTTPVFPTLTTGKLFLVTGLGGGREAFLGKAVAEPDDDHLVLEGRSVSRTRPGVLGMRPFSTTVRLYTLDPCLSIHHVTHPEAREEGLELLRLAGAQLAHATHPLLFQWVDSALIQDPHAGVEEEPRVDPFQSFYDTFSASAEQCRRALYLSPQVASPRELDKISELEGDLCIELGKVTNLIAVKFHQLLEAQAELRPYLASLRGPLSKPAPGPLAGWGFLMERIRLAKDWGRRQNDVALVRGMNSLIKEGNAGINEVVLEHTGALDALIAETFDRYGVSFEIHADSDHADLTPRAAHPDSGRVPTLLGIPV